MKNTIPIFLLLALAVLGVSGAAPVQGKCAMPRMAPVMQGGCTNGCCTDMVCCVKQGRESSPRAPLQAPPRDATMLAAVLPRVFSLLYELPPTERQFVIRDQAGAHSPTPLVTSCIWLI